MLCKENARILFLLYNLGDIRSPFHFHGIENALSNFEQRGHVIQISAQTFWHRLFVLINKLVIDDRPCILQNSAYLNFTVQVDNALLPTSRISGSERYDEGFSIVTHPISAKIMSFVDTLTHIKI